MIGLLHGRWRRRVSLLASGVLSPAERAAVEAHLRTCAACREEHGDLVRVLALIGADPVRYAEPPLPASVLAARVRARLEADAPAAPRRLAALRPAILLGGVAAALVAALLLPRPGLAPAPGPEPERAVVSGEMLDRMERTLVREQAARYLNEAGAVLVTVATRSHDCDHDPERVDVAAETSRSRELLQRRALLVELDADEVATARPLIEDVEDVLLEVASLEACARSGDLERISERIAQRRLLMKIDLMARELQG